MQLNVVLLMIVAQITVTSPDQQYSAHIDYYPGTELVTQALTLKHDNTLCFVKNSPGGVTFFVNNQGSIFGIGERALYFYDVLGNEILLKHLNAPNGFDFSPDNTIFFASDIDGLWAYDCEGSVKYRFPASRLFSCNENAEIVAMVSAESLFVFDHGERIYSALLSSPYVWSIELREDNGLILLHLPSATDEHVYAEQAGER